MSFIILVLGVIVTIGIAIFSLNMQSRETFFLVHYYYLDSAREQLAKSIQKEVHDWINHEMRLGNSGAKTKILEKIHIFEDFTIDLEQNLFSESLENSKKIAEFVGFEFEAKVHFKYLEPFFGTPESNKYESDALIFPHPKECRGVFTIEVEISKDGVSSKVYDAWYNFRFVNVLPPVVSRFSFFMKNQTKQNGFVGNINRLPMSFNEDKKHNKGGIIETERSTMRPLIIINSLNDFQINGQTEKTVRTFDPNDTLNNIDYKGWVFLGTEEPKGIILNLASYYAFNFETGFRATRVRNVDGSGKFYYGDYFHRQKGQQFKFSTSGEFPEANIATMPKPYDGYEWGDGDTELNFLMTSEFKNYGSLFKSITYLGNTHRKYSKFKKRRQFYNYYNDIIDPAQLTEMGFTSEADYRSQHPALLKPFGSYFYTKTPSRFFDNRSPTLILGPVRYSFMTVNNLRQESALHKIFPYQHISSDNPPTPSVLPLPYINVDLENDGQTWINKSNFTIDPNTKDWIETDVISDDKLNAKDGSKTSNHFKSKNWGLFSETGPSDYLLASDAEDTLFYWEQMGSAVWLDNYLHAYNAMISNGGSSEGGNADNVLKLDQIKSLNSTDEVNLNDQFFFPDNLSNGQLFNANRLVLYEFSENNATHKRIFFKGKLGNLSLFADSFKFDPNSGHMNSEVFDLRFKATHVTDVKGFEQTMLKEGIDQNCILELDGIVYIHSTDGKDSDEPEELNLGSNVCENKKLLIEGKGILIYDHDILIPNDVLIRNADSLNPQRNQKSDSANPFDLIDIPPLSIISVNGEIKIGSSVSEIYAYLIALSEENGTIGWITKPPDHDVSIIGGAAIHHLNLDDINLIENNWVVSTSNGDIRADKITTSKRNIFYRNSGMNSDGRLRVVFNNNFLPNVEENVNLHFTFVTSKGVHLVQ